MDITPSIVALYILKIRRDPDHGMARTMDLMRELYGLNVPKGWVPVMADLRLKNRASQNRAAHPQKRQRMSLGISPVWGFE